MDRPRLVALDHFHACRPQAVGKAVGTTVGAGADAKSLARAIRTRGRVDPIVVNSAGDLATVLPDVLGDGDLLLMMGAGDIGHAAQQIAANGFAGESK